MGCMPNNIRLPEPGRTKTSITEPGDRYAVVQVDGGYDNAGWYVALPMEEGERRRQILPWRLPEEAALDLCRALNHARLDRLAMAERSRP